MMVYLFWMKLILVLVWKVLLVIGLLVKKEFEWLVCMGFCVWFYFNFVCLILYLDKGVRLLCKNNIGNLYW